MKLNKSERVDYGFFLKTKECVATAILHSFRQSAYNVPAHGVLCVVKRGVSQGEVDVSTELIIELVLVEQAR